MSKFEYGGAYLRYPVQGQVVEFEDGSTVQEYDIFNGLPSFICQADILFVDPPWNIGNLRSFYTKANMVLNVVRFEKFYKRFFECIAIISPRTCYVEVGKEFLGEFLIEMKSMFKSVTFYNSMYYRNPKNICYVIRGSNRRKKLPLDGMDESEIISWICANEDYQCIGDLCMGQGLVGLAAYANGKRFVGTELNHKRLSVLVEKLQKKGLSYNVRNIYEKNKSASTA